MERKLTFWFLDLTADLKHSYNYESYCLELQATVTMTVFPVK